MQSEGESLADYSRVLMRLHDGMEQAAATLAEGQALALLRDNALKEQLVCSGSATTVRSPGTEKTCSGISGSPLLPNEGRSAPLTSGG